MFISYRVDDEIKLTFPIEMNAEELATLVGECNEDLNQWVQWAVLGFSQEDAPELHQFYQRKI